MRHRRLCHKRGKFNPKVPWCKIKLEIEQLRWINYVTINVLGTESKNNEYKQREFLSFYIAQRTTVSSVSILTCKSAGR